jgi:hypothetical protein
MQMKKINSNTDELMSNPLFMKDYFISNGIVEVDNRDIYDTINCFAMKDNHLSFNIMEYYTTASLDICLAFFFPKFTHSEIKQIVSMFTFHHKLFSDTIPENDVIYIMSTDTNITFASKIIDLLITKENYMIQQESTFFKRNHSLKKSTIDKMKVQDFQKIISKQLKISLSSYFKKHIKDVNVELINKVLEESVDDYNKRINNKPFFKDYNDYDFFVNIKNTKIHYKTIMIKDYVQCNMEPESELTNGIDLVLLKHNPEKNKSVEKIIDRISMNDQVTLYLHTKNIKTLRKLLNPVFQKQDLSYLLSIIALFDFHYQLKHPYANEILLTIYKDPKKMFSKECAYTSNFIFNFACKDFNISIGRETELHTYEFSYKHDSFAAIYKKLCEHICHTLAKSSDIEPEQLSYQHVKLEQMKNA